MTDTPPYAQVAHEEVDSTDYLLVAPQATPQERSQRHWLAEVRSPLRVIGYYFALVYTFIVFTQLHQLLILALGVDIRLLTIIGTPMIMLVLASGGVQRTLRWSAAKYWVGYSFLMVIAVAFSSWRSESLSITLAWIRVEVLILFVIAGCVMTWREVNRLLTVLAWAAVVDVIAGRLFAGQIAGRFKLTGTTMSDPNDYAAQLILILPCLLLVVVSASQFMVGRIIAAGFFLYGLYLILLTGSRGALIAIVITILFCLWKLRPSQKIFAASIVILLFCATPFVVPQRILTRFSTLFQSVDFSGKGPGLAGEASAEARRYLLKQSIVATLRHPIFGVGAGQFQNYEGRKAREAGLRGSWHETHNSFTQVSSEIGIPALLFFLAAIISTYRMLDSVYRTARSMRPTKDTQQIIATAFCLLISLIGFCTASFFLSLAYRFYLPALTGLAIALYRAVQPKWRPAFASTANVSRVGPTP
jgi:O-antigen ligase